MACPHSWSARVGFVLAFSAIAGRLAAQAEAFHIDRFTVDDGLAQNQVSSVVQDRAGFIWVGTSRGLQRYDGYSFVRYSALQRDAPRELDESIRQLHLDALGALWIETPRALFRFDPASRTLTRLTLSADGRAWAPDSAGRVWIMDGKTLTSIDARSTPLRVETVERWPSVAKFTIAFATSRTGGVWLTLRDTSGYRVVRAGASTRTPRSYRLEFIGAPSALVEDREGRVWVSGAGGVAVLDPGADRFRRLAESGGAVMGALVIEHAASGSVIVASDRWIAHLDRSGRVIHRWDAPELFGKGVGPPDIAIDREGGVWVATLWGGVFRLDRERQVFGYASSRSKPSLPLASDFVSALAEARDGALWIGTFSAGAYRIGADGRSVDVLRNNRADLAGLASNLIWDFAQDRAGTVWAATGDGICAAVRDKFRCYRTSERRFEVSDIAQDADGNFWLGRYKEGVIGFEPTSGRFGTALPVTEAVYSVFADGVSDSSWLWIGGGALYRIRMSQGSLVEPLQRLEADVSIDEPIYEFHRDAQRQLWLTSHRGLQRWDPTSERFAPIDAPALRHTTVFSIEEDAEGRFWLGTAHGLVRYSPRTGAARRFSRQDGVMSGEFNRRAALRRRNGEMLFGGVHGLTIFRPDLLTQPRDPPPLAFTRWRKVTKSGLVDEALDGVERVKLSPGERAFTIDFAALTYAAGPSPRYRYRLAGLSDEWIESSERQVTYASPPPGRYVFNVQTATGREGGGEEGWNAPGVSLSVEVVPPIWGTTWFKALLLALVIAAAWLLHQVRVRRAVATERLRLRISRDLHDEIGAGLSSIALLSDSVGSSGIVTDRERTQLQRIARSARTMVGDLRDIVWAIDPGADKVEDVMARMKDVASTLLRDVSVTFDVPAATDLTNTIGMTARRDLLLAFKELLHNVARHAHARSVRIELQARRGALELVVSDDGVGFNPNDGRVGTGLKSLRERAARLGGDLDIRSEAGRGTTARLTLKRT